MTHHSLRQDRYNEMCRWGKKMVQKNKNKFKNEINYLCQTIQKQKHKNQITINYFNSYHVIHSCYYELCRALKKSLGSLRLLQVIQVTSSLLLIPRLSSGHLVRASWPRDYSTHYHVCVSMLHSTSSCNISNRTKILTLTTQSAYSFMSPFELCIY